MRDRIETLEAKFQKSEEHVEAARKEREHEIVIKKEVRKLREEDFRKLAERLKRKDTLRKMYILEKEYESAENIE